jgi:alpha-beta hydrolase superfamily lysophospholipase
VGSAIIDHDLQQAVRVEVEYKAHFSCQGRQVEYRVSSRRGLEFLESAIQKGHHHGLVQTPGGITLFYQFWTGAPGKDVFFYNHGNAENSSAHPLLFYSLLQKGYGVISFDQQGFGESDGIRGSIGSFIEYRDNLDFMYDYLLGRYSEETGLPVPPVIMAGFSLGGLLTLQWLIHSFKRGKSLPKEVILFAPYLKTHKRLVSPFTEIMLILLAPFFSMTKMLRQDSQRAVLCGSVNEYLEMYKNLSDNESFLRRRFNDKRIHRINSRRWISRAILLQKSLFHQVRRKDVKSLLNERVPLSIFYSGKDRVVDSDAIEKMATLLDIKDTIYYSAGSFHEFLDYEDSRGDEFYRLLFSILD